MCHFSRCFTNCFTTSSSQSIAWERVHMTLSTNDKENSPIIRVWSACQDIGELLTWLRQKCIGWLHLIIFMISCVTYQFRLSPNHTNWNVLFSKFTFYVLFVDNMTVNWYEKIHYESNVNVHTLNAQFLLVVWLFFIQCWELNNRRRWCYIVAHPGVHSKPLTHWDREKMAQFFRRHFHTRFREWEC